jgi:two-component system, cell cycle sensor histidine kinase and response regulator CckA
MPGGGQLTIETANVELSASAAPQHVGVPPGPYVMLLVNDTGSGMDELTRAHIFEPFYTTKEQGKGTGLGLATVYGIITQSEGAIRVDSEVGRGVTFRIYLPRVDAAAELRSGPADGRDERTGSETILLVEDEPQVRYLARSVLEARGYTVLEATQPDEAIQHAEQHSGPIDLLLTDVVMPGASGPELAALLADQRPGVPVVYMSGYASETLLGHGLREGELEFLQKPFTPVALAQKVRDVLDARPTSGSPR